MWLLRKCIFVWAFLISAWPRFPLSRFVQKSKSIRHFSSASHKLLISQSKCSVVDSSCRSSITTAIILVPPMPTYIESAVSWCQRVASFTAFHLWFVIILALEEVSRSRLWRAANWIDRAPAYFAALPLMCALVFWSRLTHSAWISVGSANLVVDHWTPRQWNCICNYSTLSPKWIVLKLCSRIWLYIAFPPRDSELVVFIIWGCAGETDP